MPIKRFYATQDAQITNSRRTSLLSSGSLANMGLSDTGELFSIYNITGFNSSSLENDLSRILIQFNIDDILSDEDYNTGSVKYYLRMFNVKHDSTLPNNFKINVHPVSDTWTEGFGLDIDNYTDLGAVNWISSSDGVEWDNPGADYYEQYYKEQHFEKGTEDLEIDITDFIALWNTGTIDNNGVILKLSSSYEFDTRSFYKKSFSMRGTEYFYNKPCIEVRWDDSKVDNRNNSLSTHISVPSSYTLNTIYFINNIGQELFDVPGIGQNNLYVSFYTGTLSSSFIAAATATWESTGVYKAQFSVNYTGTLYDKWHSNIPIQNPTVTYYSGTILVKDIYQDQISDRDNFIISMPNLQQEYHNENKVRLDLFIRKRNWEPTVYSTAVAQRDHIYVKNAYYEIKRSIDNKIIIPFATGSIKYTKLSYDHNGHYFYLDMNIFEPDYEYLISYLFEFANKKVLMKDKFKFRIRSEMESR